MREIRYLSKALEDLRAISTYYRNIDPDVADRIRADIEGAIALLQENAYSGHAAGPRGLRRKLTRRYRFKIAHRVLPDVIEIIGIWRFQNRTA